MAKLNKRPFTLPSVDDTVSDFQGLGFVVFRQPPIVYRSSDKNPEEEVSTRLTAANNMPSVSGAAAAASNEDEQHQSSWQADRENERKLGMLKQLINFISFFIECRIRILSLGPYIYRPKLK